MMKTAMFTATVVLAAALVANAAKPNIIYILAADLGDGDVSARNADSIGITFQTIVPKSNARSRKSSK